MPLPDKFLDRLKLILPPEKYTQIVESFTKPNTLCIRINTLKVTIEEAKAYLDSKQILFNPISWSTTALILPNCDKLILRDDVWVLEGKIYIQELSSQLPVNILNPLPQDKVLDMCAAPGSKTTQLSAYMQNQGHIVAIEAIRSRYYRLKANCERAGATNVKMHCLDGRRYRSEDLFDKILVDAPCSSEGRFETDNAKSFGYWSLRKIKEMSKKQKGLLLSATRLLKKGGSILYSTCTFAPEENEAVIDWVLRKTDGQISLVPIELNDLPRMDAIKSLAKRTFDPSITHTYRILPTQNHSGFFLAKLVSN